MISDQVPAQTPEPEPMGAPVATTRTPRPRWLLPVGGAVVALAVVIGVVAGLTLNGARGGSAAPAAGYVPADATFYAELKLGLTTDQAASLRTFLGHFPGVDADRWLTDQLDTQLDQATSAMPSGVVYSKDIKPWFDGTVALAMIGYPSPPSATTPSATMPTPDMLIFAGVKDQAAANAFGTKLQAAVTADLGKVTTSTHGSATIWTATPLANRSTLGTPFSWTITADELVAGTTADLVGTALDVHSGSKAALADRQAFKDGLSRLPADRELTVSLDPAAIVGQAKAQLASLQPALGNAIASMTASAPTFAVASGRVTGDRLAFDGAVSFSGATLAQNRDRGLAALAPGDAIFFSDKPDVGKTLTSLVNLAKSAAASDPSTAQQLQQMESVLGGDLSSFVSWIGDAAVVAGATNHEPWAGLIITPTNADDARLKLSQLRGLLQLATGAGTSLTVTDADHGGTTVTTIKVKAGSDVPAWATTYQYAVSSDRVVIGSGETFVARVLDMTKADSLAAQQRFSAAIDSLGGASNVGDYWLDISALRAEIEAVLPADAATAYKAQVQPYLAPLDYVAGTTQTDGQLSVGRVALVVK